MKKHNGIPHYEIKPFLEIRKLEDGKLECLYRPCEGHSPTSIGIALASATRVITESFLGILNLPKFHREQIESMISDAYQADLKLGDGGEEESTKPFKSE